jgi:hypothetical protein
MTNSFRTTALAGAAFAGMLLLAGAAHAEMESNTGYDQRGDRNWNTQGQAQIDTRDGVAEANMNRSGVGDASYQRNVNYAYDPAGRYNTNYQAYGMQSAPRGLRGDPPGTAGTNRSGTQSAGPGDWVYPVYGEQRPYQQQRHPQYVGMSNAQMAGACPYQRDAKGIWRDSDNKRVSRREAQRADCMQGDTNRAKRRNNAESNQ